MESDSAKLIGAGIAAVGLAGVGIGIGILFGLYVLGAMRNPKAAPRVFGSLMLGFALTEQIALFALVISFLVLFS